MDPILAWNPQNCFGFWSSAPDPAGGAYDAPPDPLVAKGFLLSAIEALLLWHSQFELLAHSHKHIQLLDLKFFSPAGSRCSILWSWGIMDTSVHTLSSPNLCFRAFCYFLNPASNKNFTLIIFSIWLLKNMKLIYPKM